MYRKADDYPKFPEFALPFDGKLDQADSRRHGGPRRYQVSDRSRAPERSAGGGRVAGRQALGPVRASGQKAPHVPQKGEEGFPCRGEEEAAGQTSAEEGDKGPARVPPEGLGAYRPPPPFSRVDGKGTRAASRSPPSFPATGGDVPRKEAPRPRPNRQHPPAPRPPDSPRQSVGSGGVRGEAVREPGRRCGEDTPPVLERIQRGRGSPRAGGGVPEEVRTIRAPSTPTPYTGQGRTGRCSGSWESASRSSRWGILRKKRPATRRSSPKNAASDGKMSWIESRSRANSGRANGNTH